MPMYSLWSAVFPPPPVYTDKDLPSLEGKVYIVTGAASGIGLELSKFIYLAGGTLYVACRSTARCADAIAAIEEQTRNVQPKGARPGSKGRLESMVIDFSNLATVKPAVEAFMSKESRLDVLVQNAAVMNTPESAKDVQGHNLEIGTNCLAPYLLALLLEPILIRTASMPDTPKYTVRVVWVVALAQRTTNPGGMEYDEFGAPQYLPGTMKNYFQSKCGTTWLATRYAERVGRYGIMSTSVHPGIVKTELQRHLGLVEILVGTLVGPFFKPAVYAAYSELYAAFYPDIPASHNGGHLMAWGRLADMPVELEKGMRSSKEGGNGRAKIFFDYCDREIKDFM